MIQDSMIGKHLGKYRLLKLLGRGGMGDVYLSEHELLESRVAVKLLPDDLARDQSMVTRFIREARAAARLRHPHIIRIHDVGQEEGTNYFSMDYVEGSTLSEVMSGTHRLSNQEIISISCQVLAALAEAHSADIVHRDIKPENVLIDIRGDAVVMDFGIAKAASATTDLTALGAFVGTVHYASPEQVRGKGVDTRSDLYSWGVVMYEMATGFPPFIAEDNTAIMYQHVHQTPVPPHEHQPDLPGSLSSFILRLLAKDPGDRFASAEEALEVLQQVGLSPPMDRDTRIAEPEPRARALVQTGSRQLKSGDFQRALNSAREALELHGSSNAAADLEEQALAELAREERIEGLSLEAKQLIKGGFFQDAARVITGLAEVSRDKEATLDWLMEVQDLGRENAPIEDALQRIRAMEAAGDFNQAETILAGLEQDYPSNPLVTRARSRFEGREHLTDLKNQATMLAEQGDLFAARTKLQQVLEVDPQNAGARLGLEDLKTRLAPAVPGNHASTVAQASSWEGGPPPSPSASDAGSKRAFIMAGLALVAALTVCGGLWWAFKEPPQRGTTTKLAQIGPAPSPENKPSPAPKKPAASDKPAKLQRIPDAKALAQAEQMADQGRRFLQAGEIRQAEEAFRSALALNPNLARAREGLKQTLSRRVQGLVAEGEYLLSQDRPEPAAEAFAKALELDDKSMEARLGLELAQKRQKMTRQHSTQAQRQADPGGKAAELVSQGQRLLAKGDPVGAEKAFEQALSVSPGFPGAIQGLAKLRQSREANREALDRSLNQGEFHLTKGRPHQAQKEFEKALALNPTSPRAQDGLALARRKIKALREEALIKVSKGERLARTGKLDQAKAAFQKAQSISPGLVEAKNGLALVAKKLSAQKKVADKPKARAKPQRKTLRLLPRAGANAEERHQAQLAIVQGTNAYNAQRYDLAVKHFRRYVSFFPNDPTGKQHLQLAERMLVENRMGSLSISSQPPGHLYLDGRKIGSTPITLNDVPVGSHQVEVRAFGGRSSRMVQVRARSLTELQIQITGGSLSVQSTPWAEVYIGESRLGNTPLSIHNLPLGPQTVTLKRTGFKPMDYKAAFWSGKQVTINASLKRADGE